MVKNRNFPFYFITEFISLIVVSLIYQFYIYENDLFSSIKLDNNLQYASFYFQYNDISINSDIGKFAFFYYMCNYLVIGFFQVALWHKFQFYKFHRDLVEFKREICIFVILFFYSNL